MQKFTHDCILIPNCKSKRVFIFVSENSRVIVANKLEVFIKVGNL